MPESGRPRQIEGSTQDWWSVVLCELWSNSNARMDKVWNKVQIWNTEVDLRLYTTIIQDLVVCGLLTVV